MKKKGFTLAEVLITLGIIGVVAALTAPALIQNTGSAKVGPTLAKAVTTLEIANQNMLSQTEAPNINAIAGNNINAYITALSNVMKVSLYNDSSSEYTLQDYNGKAYSTGANGYCFSDLFKVFNEKNYAMTRDGLLYIIALRDLTYSMPQRPPLGASFDSPRVQKWLEYLSLVSSNNTAEAGTVIIDINGKKEPNKIGKDAFVFVMMQDGTLRPYGGNQWNTKTDSDNKAYNWQNGTTDKCNSEEVTTGWTCAGSIFENGLKIIY